MAPAVVRLKARASRNRRGLCRAGEVRGMSRAGVVGLTLLGGRARSGAVPAVRQHELAVCQRCRARGEGRDGHRAGKLDKMAAFADVGEEQLCGARRRFGAQALDQQPARVAGPGCWSPGAGRVDHRRVGALAGPLAALVIAGHALREAARSSRLATDGVTDSREGCPERLRGSDVSAKGRRPAAPAPEGDATLGSQPNWEVRKLVI